MIRTLLATALLALAASLPAAIAQAASAPQMSLDPGLLEVFVRDQAPDNATSVGDLRTAGYRPGDRVSVRAQVGGRNPPWIPGMAVMMLADAEKLAACATGGCGAPWDFCSVPPDTLMAHTGVVRWLDGEGNPIPVGFDQIVDLAPLSTVVVTGTVADVGDPSVLVIDADGLHLEDPGPFAELMQR